MNLCYCYFSTKKGNDLNTEEKKGKHNLSKCLFTIGISSYFNGEARLPSGRASDSEARGRGSVLTQVAVLYP